MFKSYIEEVYYLKYYIISVALVFIIGYSFCFLGDSKVIGYLGDEDNLFENLTALNFFIGFIICLLVCIKHKNIFILIMSIILFIGAGEEISWGQRFFNFEPPEFITENNVQGEFNIHNLEVFNSESSEGQYKYGLNRFLTINLLSKLFFVFIGIFLPLCVYHLKIAANVAIKIKLPIPPISIGIFSLINWIIVRLIPYFILEKDFRYYDSCGEFFEFVNSFILLTICFYFLKNSRNSIYGKDIKRMI